MNAPKLAQTSYYGCSLPTGKFEIFESLRNSSKNVVIILKLNKMAFNLLQQFNFVQAKIDPITTNYFLKTVVEWKVIEVELCYFGIAVLKTMFINNVY